MQLAFSPHFTAQWSISPELVLNMIPRPSEYVEIFSKHSFIF